MLTVHYDLCSLLAGQKSRTREGGLQSLQGDNTHMILWLFGQKTKEALVTQPNELTESKVLRGQSDSKGLTMQGVLFNLSSAQWPPLIPWLAIEISAPIFSATFIIQAPHHELYKVKFCKASDYQRILLLHIIIGSFGKAPIKVMPGPGPGFN